MNDENKLKTTKGLAIKIIIPVLLLCIVAGIWFVKNQSKNNGVENVGNPDFALHVTEKIDMEKLKSYGLPILIDFGSDSCIPCRELAPILEELNTELQGKAIIRYIDVEKYQDFANGYPISVIPTQVFIDATGKPYVPTDPEASQMKLYSKKDTGEHALTAHEGGLTKEQLMNILKEMGMK